VTVLTQSDEQFAELEDEAEAELSDDEPGLDELMDDEPGIVALEVVVLLAGWDVL
jgi:transposase